MFDKISTGAYVIRNKKTSTVLHIENPDVYNISSPVLCHYQEENLYQDQQIWWVEPLLNSKDKEGNEEFVYYIANTPSGRALGVGDKGKIIMYEQDGGPWQWWKLRRVHEHNEGVYYNLVAAWNHRVVRLANEDLQPETGDADLAPVSDENCWEFVIPAVGYPPGWIQIQNVKTGDLLSHTYRYDPPVLIPPPTTPKLSQYREGWQFQWTIFNSKSSSPTSTARKNSWCIKNRLTEAHLVNNDWDIGGARLDRVNAWKMGHTHDSTWKLELDPSCNWKIINVPSKCLLQQTNVPRNDGMQVICADSTASFGDGTKSWVLRPPAIEMNEDPELPPEYEDSRS